MAILLRGGTRDWGQVLRGLAEFRNPYSGPPRKLSQHLIMATEAEQRLVIMAFADQLRIKRTVLEETTVSIHRQPP
jgi:hypothetical protein